MNQVALVGRLTKDPEYRETEGGLELCRFTLAVDRQGREAGSDKADFPRVITFGNIAKVCGKYLSKGKLVAVTGRIQTGSYTNTDGVKIYTTDVAASNVTFLSPKSGESVVPEEPTGFSALDADIPF